MNDDTRDDPRASAWLDGELEVTERDEVAALIATDAAWARSIEELAATRSLVRELPVSEPPSGFLESLLDPAEGSVTPLASARSRRARSLTAALAGVAAAAALLVAIVVPSVARTHPALATDVRVHQAGAAASGDPVSELAPLGTPLRVGR